MSKIETIKMPLSIEHLNRDMVKEMIGYELITTFYEDFSIAEMFGGTKAIKDTYKRVLKDWGNNYKYITELYMILNWKIWKKQEKKQYEFSDLYYELWTDLEEWVDDHFSDDEMKYFIRTTD